MKLLVEHLNKRLDWRSLPERVQWVIDQAIAIQQIAAPTFNEASRAAYVARQFEYLGLNRIETDELFNVYGLLEGKDRQRPAVMVSAHTDTVFQIDTDLTVHRDADLIYGPGLGDNSMGVAGLLGLIAALRESPEAPESDLWFIANTREEGLGDLGGIKAAFTKLKDQVAFVINLEGMAFGHVYHAGIAVRRLRIRAKAEGGHSWLNFGRSSAIHGIVELGASITRLRPPETPRTTYNIGLIDGGQSINTIASEASLWLDLRSEDSRALMVFENEVRHLIPPLVRSDLAFEIEVVGDRPAGQVPPDHPLVQTALAALEQVGTQGTLETGSTDANVPLSMGCPAVTVGITRGGNAHRLDEFIETRPIADGMRQLILLTLTACAMTNDWARSR